MNDESSIPSFFSGFLKLFSGLALVQIFNLGFSLILSRYYTPEDYAFFGVFVAIVLILMEVITLKLEVTVFLPEEENEALEIVHSVFFICGLLSIIALGIVGLFAHFYQPIYFLLPLSVAVYGMNLPLTAWFNRQKKYGTLNTGRVIQAIAIPILSLVFIIFFEWHSGLVLGFVFGQAIGLLYFFASFKKLDLSLISFALVKKYLRKYVHFPKFGVLSSLINSVSKNSIVIFIELFFGARNAGFYTFGNKILSAPVGMYHSALSQVFMAQASRMESKYLNAYIRKMVWFGFALGLLPAVLVLIYGPPIFEWLFGNQWYEAGRVAQYLVLWLLSVAIISPVGFLLDIKQHLKYELGWNVALFAFRLGAILLCIVLMDFYLLLAILCGVGILMNIILLRYVLKLTHEP